MDKPTPAKLFVGQIPKAMQESELQHLFETYGNIIEFALIRDRSSRQSKGCAFLTYTKQSEADACIAALHNQYTVPGMPSPLQIKYAGTAVQERQSEIKLFIGMIPKGAGEADLTPIFAPFGEINELTVLRGQDGTSKGCAFLRYKNLESATAAIGALNGTFKMPGSPSNIVVKFAESEKQRSDGPGSKSANMTPLGGLGGLGLGMGLGMGMGMPGMGMAGMGMPGMMGMGMGMPGMGMMGMGGLPANYWDQYAQQLSQAYGYGAGAGNAAGNAGALGGLGAGNGQGAGAGGFGNAGAGGFGGAQQQQQQQQQQVQQGGFGGPTQSVYEAGPTSNPTTGANSIASQNAAAAAAFQALYASAYPGAAALGLQGMGGGLPPALAGLASGMGLGMGMGMGGGAAGGLGVIGSSKEGPPGANLFVYHLPKEYSDTDLLTMFSPYGPMESCKIITDKDSGMSKCFGFVSYQSPESATLAISQLNGFQVAGKRIKVEVKSARSGAGGFKPY